MTDDTKKQSDTNEARRPDEDRYGSGEAGYGYGGEAEGYETVEPEHPHRDSDTPGAPQPGDADDAPGADDLDRRG